MKILRPERLQRKKYRRIAQKTSLAAANNGFETGLQARRKKKLYLTCNPQWAWLTYVLGMD
jgi:hypothetical protein